MTCVTGGRRASREEAEDMLDRLIVRPIPQGSGVVWLIEPVGGSPGGALGAWPGSSAVAEGAGEKDETIRILREQVDFLQAEVEDRKRELRAEQETRRREVAALHELLAMAGGRDVRREGEGRREGTPPPAPPPAPSPTAPAPPDGAEPAPDPGSGAAAAPAGSWWRRVLGRRGELP
jgi:hypothetical protein